jgi:hypothetical protein
MIAQSRSGSNQVREPGQDSEEIGRVAMRRGPVLIEDRKLKIENSLSIFEPRLSCTHPLRPFGFTEGPTLR